MADSSIIIAGISGATTAAMAQMSRIDAPSVMRYVIYDFGDYSLYFGDLLTICGLVIAAVSAFVALRRSIRTKDGR